MRTTPVRSRVGSVLAAALIALARQVEAQPNAALPAMDRVLAAQILALDPERLSPADVRDVLARAPAPRIILLSGSVPLSTMEPFARFLVAMGYPERSLRDPASGAWDRSSWGSSTALAGTLAWYYEHDGLRPMLIGHSQGGMLALRALHELAGAFGPTVAVHDPLTGATLARTDIVDPFDGSVRPVVGLHIGYAAALATGKLPRLLLGQWSMLPKLRTVPDTVDEFTGFLIEWDPIAGTFPGAEPFAAAGTAAVRTVLLPARTSHIGMPHVLHLAENAATRAWIDAYVPGAAPPDDGDMPDTTNLLHAADIWYSVRKHWCIEAQRLARHTLAAASIAAAPP